MTSASSRALQLLSLLQLRRVWPGELLSERLEITPRTVRRDIERLRGMGYRIRAIKGPDGGYRLEAGSELPPLLFDDEQALALAVALQSPVPVAALEEAAARALAAVRQVLPERLRHRLDALRFTAIAAEAPAVAPEVLVAVSAAVRAREVLRFDYGSGEVPRRVEPHHLVAREGRWYLVGWDLDRDDWRVFRVDRLAPRTPRGARFTRRELPGGGVAAFLDARFRGGEVGGGWPCRGVVTLRMPLREVAPYVGDGAVEDLGDDGCRLSLGAWSWEALAASFGRFGGEMTAAEPAELVAAFGVLARRFEAVGPEL
ncbi:WYL domain-containing protein [Rathayibacter sp. VKM Ac-2803]|uniref:helix-turn-helix transcriptional regulator n=1 Tax=unclassified Rathayibacter TaxID=2609250 RepID=UPI00135A46F9|nr:MULTISPECIES: WYL domain-containing protein [unclassified Rathayibacter]MWV48665.1 WYL domain-containing protein [Rathayibacter sp. VKM Ac-2803]MWV60691.1 WYL domain-containing protein [Rathayibacter sp. VKM Ac-2754]